MAKHPQLETSSQHEYYCAVKAVKSDLSIGDQTAVVSAGKDALTRHHTCSSFCIVTERSSPLRA